MKTYTFRVMWFRRSPGIGSVKVSNRFSVDADDLGRARELIREANPTAETVVLVRITSAPLSV